MAYEIKYNPELKILELKFQKSITLNELQESYLEAFPIAIENECFLFLNDFSEATIDLSILDIFTWPSKIAEIAQNMKKMQRLSNEPLFYRYLFKSQDLQKI